jgi:hypothetical protein
MEKHVRMAMLSYILHCTDMAKPGYSEINRGWSRTGMFDVTQWVRLSPNSCSRHTIISTTRFQAICTTPVGHGVLQIMVRYIKHAKHKVHIPRIRRGIIRNVTSPSHWRTTVSEDTALLTWPEHNHPKDRNASRLEFRPWDCSTSNWPADQLTSFRLLVICSEELVQIQ